MSGTLRLNDTTFATETNGNITTNVSELKINDQTVIDSNKSLNVSDVKVGGNTVIDSNRKMTGVDIVPTTNFTFRNKIINGNFDIWQRGFSNNGTINSNTYPAADRWKFWNTLTSTSVSRSTFSVNQTDVPNSSYYQTITIPANSAVSDYVTFNQHIEDVNQFYSKTVTLSFYAKANSNWTIAIEPVQNFGTGGSSRQLGTSQNVNVSTSWERHSVSFNLDDINGITLGTGHNFELAFWLTAGSNFNSRTNSIPNNKSGTFDIAQIQLEEGAVPTPFEHRPISVELSLCQRYYEKSYNLETVPGTSTGTGICYQHIARSTGNLYGYYVNKYLIEKRATPSVSLYSYSGTLGSVSNGDDASDIGTSDVIYNGTKSFLPRNTSGGSIAAQAVSWHFVSEAEL